MIVTDFREAVKTELPRVEEIQGPWLRAGELSMLFAPTGVGKSLLAMSIAHAASLGRSFLGWTCERPFKVCYLEAEMSRAVSFKRLRFLNAASEACPAPGYFTIICRSTDKSGFPNLSVKNEQWKIYKEHLYKYDLIIVDPLTSACPQLEKDSDSANWYRVKPFAYYARNEGKAVLFVHHSGKSGQQLGTSLKENDMDLILRLTPPVRPLTKNKLEIQLEFMKPRDLERNQVQSLYLDFCTIQGRATWGIRSLDEVRNAQIQQAHQTIKSVVLLANQFKCSVFEVQRALQEETHFNEAPEGESISEEFWNTGEGEQEDLDF